MGEAVEGHHGDLSLLIGVISMCATFECAALEMG
jgi:hypothetical protein